VPDPRDCRFPELGSPYDDALREATAYVLERFEPIAILACGTIVAGNPDPGSDFDLYVIHREPWRQRVQKRFCGVPAEIFVNSPESVSAYLESERFRPMTAHMLVTGFPVLESDPQVAALRDRARAILAEPPALDTEQAIFERFAGALMVEDAADVIERDADAASLLATEAVHHAARMRFRLTGRFVPRHKDLLAELDRLDAPLARDVRAFLTTSDARQRLALACSIADRVFDARGFFEWESSRVPVASVPAEQAP
jgi:hypothetical protein